MKKLSIISLFFIGWQFSQAQGQFNNWYCGYGAGVNFNTSPPSIITPNPMYTDDNSATLSDSAGNVMFFANGTTAYDRNGNIMPHGSGLSGDPSSGQTATIVQLPGSANLYYLFTMDKQAYPNGATYSVVDMTLNGGLGDIDSTRKNITILAPATEKIIAIRHSNGTDAWILIHEWNSDAFRAYLLTASGLDTTPVITHIGTVNTGGYSYGYNAQGQLEVNKANNMIAAAIYSDGNIQLFNFDNSTGILSNSILINLYRAWGLQFSPNGQYLYATSWTGSTLYQYDISTYVDTIIAASQDSIGTSYNEGYLQTGPDGKIYVAKWQTNYIGVINDPDNAGLASNYVDTGFYTGTYQSSAGLVDKLLLNSSTPSGIDIVANEVSLSCYPSPSSGTFTVDMSSFDTGDKQISIYDELGQRIFNVQSSQTKIQIDENLASGIYTVIVTDDTHSRSTQVAINK